MTITITSGRVLEALAFTVQMFVVRTTVDAVALPDIGVTGMTAKVFVERRGW